MGLIKTAKATFKRNVQILHGGAVAVDLEVEFKYIKPRDYDEFMRRQSERKNIDSIAEIIVSWSGLKDESNNEVPYSLNALTELLDEYWCASTILEAWVSGLTGARQKN